jgi:hypothetical protein
MKKKIILITIIFAVIFTTNLGMAQSALVIEDPVFTFDLIPEGTHISHEFILRNTGDSLVKITAVQPP